MRIGELALARPVFDATGTALIGSRCPRCGDTRFPARKLCPNDQVLCEEIQFSGLGTVYEAVKIFLAPPGFKAPLWVGYIDLDEGVRLFAQIGGGEESEPSHGDRVRMHVEPVAVRDEPVFGPVFRKAS